MVVMMTKGHFTKSYIQLPLRLELYFNRNF